MYEFKIYATSLAELRQQIVREAEAIFSTVQIIKPEPEQPTATITKVTPFPPPGSVVFYEQSTPEPVEPEPEQPAPHFDADGLPHDARIHSAAKTRNANGTWRRRKGVDDAMVASVEQELRARLAPPMPMPEQVDLSVADWRALNNQVAPPMPMPEPELPLQVTSTATIPPMPEQVAQQATPLTFPQFMDGLTAQMSRGGLTPAYMTGLLQRAGMLAGKEIMSIVDAGDDPKLIEIFISLLRQDGMWQ